MAKAVAACDTHLAMHVKMLVNAKTTKTMSVSRVEKDQAYSCTCGVPADWYIREYTPRKAS